MIPSDLRRPFGVAFSSYFIQIPNGAPTRLTKVVRYTAEMTNDPHIDRHLALCKRMFLRLLADGSWPWPELPESRNPADMIESETKSNDL